MADSVTVTVQLSEAPWPACPMWMNTIHTFAVKYNLTRLRVQLENMAESRGCALTEATAS